MASSNMIAEWLKKFKAAFPNREVSEETTVIYCCYLQDIPDEAFKKACEMLIMRSRFFPSIAEIREIVPKNLRLLEGKIDSDLFWLGRGQTNPNENIGLETRTTKKITGSA